MAHIWQIDRGNAWKALELTEDAYAITPETLAPTTDHRDGGATQAVRLRRSGSTSTDWILLCPAKGRVWINGHRLQVGLRVLKDRDRVAVRTPESNAPTEMFFSTERLAAIEPFPEEANSRKCARCKNDIKPGQRAVRCPGAGCSAWYHQTSERNCFTYEGLPCLICGHPTALDAEYRWSPEEL